MIKQTVLKDKFIKSYSTRNRKIKQIDTGVIYDSAVDLKDNVHEYEEVEDEYTEAYKASQKQKAKDLLNDGE